LAESGVIDRRVLDSLLESLGGDEEFLAELLETYFDDSPQQFATMQEALATGNAEALRRAAHSLKSNSANFGAMPLSAICKGLEDMGKAGVLDGAAERIAAAAAEYDRGRAALEAIQGGG
jgi:HPt (histidine-containing phosphotransfer) domain-containing protein